MSCIKLGFVIASVYAACRVLSVPRQLGEISEAVNADPIFAGKCYSMVLRHLKIRPPSIDPNMYMTRIAKNAGVGEMTYRKAKIPMLYLRQYYTLHP